MLKKIKFFNANFEFYFRASINPDVYALLSSNAQSSVCNGVVHYKSGVFIVTSFLKINKSCKCKNKTSDTALTFLFLSKATVEILCDWYEKLGSLLCTCPDCFCKTSHCVAGRFLPLTSLIYEFTLHRSGFLKFSNVQCKAIIEIGQRKLLLFELHSCGMWEFVQNTQTP